MRIVREIMPNGMPLLVQGLRDGDGAVSPESIEVYPLMRPSVAGENKRGYLPPDLFLLSNVIVLPLLPVGMGGLSKRLAKRLSANSDYENA